MNLTVYFDFLRFALRIKENVSPKVKDIDWTTFYHFSQKQALLGVIFDGIQRLPSELAPNNSNLMMEWFGKSIVINKRNHRMYEASNEVYATIREMGYRCCVLKGQGNAVYYPNLYSRTPGDIDVWVLTSREELRKIALALSDSSKTISREIIHHIELEHNGIQIELHPTPSIPSNPLRNIRMQKWFERNADLQCSNIINLPDGYGEIAIPTMAFNMVYQLEHLYHHFFYEGIGLRQIIDYYFVISNNSFVISDVLRHELKQMGLLKFAGAVMYVLNKVLGLPENRMIVPMDVKRGKLLLDEILTGGNFGHFDIRNSHHSAIGHNIQRLKRDLRLARYYPEEALAEPFFRIWHFFWREKTHGLKVSK